MGAERVEGEGVGRFSSPRVTVGEEEKRRGEGGKRREAFARGKAPWLP
jgi:hypothetical protein